MGSMGYGKLLTEKENLPSLKNIPYPHAIITLIKSANIYIKDNSNNEHKS